MTVRQSTAEDLPQIIALLKQSIGEVLTPKTEAYFLWKHQKNPFGRSKVLLAVEDNKIIGLRAFMYWRWASQQQNLLAVRAVDTATDPAFQGKGIFKKLTMQAVNECKTEGVDMVFNSPNPISMQGYLKMGWSSVGKLPLYIGVGSLVPRFYSAETVNGFYSKYAVEIAINKLDRAWALPKAAKLLHTPIDYNYLSWRFLDCPVAKYGAVIEPGKFGYIFRLKKLKKFIELRICEVWTESTPGAEQLAIQSFKKLMKAIRPALLSCGASPLFSNGDKQIAKLFGPYKKGPVITIRPLATDNLNNFAEFGQWKPSLGSMELF
ncbi:MAG: GNAT family N-acetyltransferase [Ferruginibacter sp.]